MPRVAGAWWSASCRGRFGYHPVSVLPLMRTTLRGQLGEAMVVMAGYDDASITNAVDQVMAEAEAQGVKRVLWLTYRTNTGYVLPGGLAGQGPVRQSQQRAGGCGATAQLAEGSRLGCVHRRTRADVVRRRRHPPHASPAPSALADVHQERARRGAGDRQMPSRERADRRRRQRTAPAERLHRAPLRLRAARRRSECSTPETRHWAARTGMLGAGRTVAIDVSEIVPADADATVLSVTATGSCVPGFLTVFACGARPPTSNINYEVGRTTAGLAITPMTDGKACIFASSRDRCRRRCDGRVHARRRPVPPDDADTLDRHARRRRAARTDHRRARRAGADRSWRCAGKVASRRTRPLCG